MFRVKFRVGDRVRVWDRLRVTVRLQIGWYMDEQMAVGIVVTGGMEVALYAKGTELLCTQPLPYIII